MRLGEICALKWEDIDLKNQKIEVNKTIQRINDNGKSYTIIGAPKTKYSYRVIFINPILLQFLNQSKKEKGFILTGNEKYLDPRSYQYYFKKNFKGIKYSRLSISCFKTYFCDKMCTVSN